MKVHASFLAPLVLFAFLGIVLAGAAWELPTMQKEFATDVGEGTSVSMIVRGLRCRGTSNFFMEVVERIPGVLSVTTFVQEHRAEIEYNPDQTDPEAIARAIEVPVRLHDGRVVEPFKVTEIEP